MLNRICLGLYSPEIYTGSHVRSLVLSGSSSDIFERQQDSSRPTSYPISPEANKKTNKRLNSNKGSKTLHVKLNWLCLRNDQQQRFWLSICYRYRRRRRPIGWLFVCFTVFFFAQRQKEKKQRHRETKKLSPFLNDYLNHGSDCTILQLLLNLYYIVNWQNKRNNYYLTSWSCFDVLTFFFCFCKMGLSQSSSRSLALSLNLENKDGEIIHSHPQTVIEKR